MTPRLGLSIEEAMLVAQVSPDRRRYSYDHPKASLVLDALEEMSIPARLEATDPLVGFILECLAFAIREDSRLRMVRRTHESETEPGIRLAEQMNADIAAWNDARGPGERKRPFVPAPQPVESLDQAIEKLSRMLDRLPDICDALEPIHEASMRLRPLWAELVPELSALRNKWLAGDRGKSENSPFDQADVKRLKQRSNALYRILSKMPEVEENLLARRDGPRLAATDVSGEMLSLRETVDGNPFSTVISLEAAKFARRLMIESSSASTRPVMQLLQSVAVSLADLENASRPEMVSRHLDDMEALVGVLQVTLFRDGSDLGLPRSARETFDSIASRYGEALTVPQSDGGRGIGIG